MRVTEYFDLDLKQGSIDFVDVDVTTDVPVYIDPSAIRHQSGDWSDACVVSLQTFFESLLTAIRDSDDPALRNLIFPLVEPNETHLGQSTGQSRGRSLGSRTKAEELFDSLRNSKAVQSGFLHDLEDSALMVEGIDKDIVSDITTCVIRRHLISYTQSQCLFHEVPLELQHSGPIWDSQERTWVEEEVMLPRANDDKLLLVPKSIVRASLTVDKGRYYRGYLRPYFERELLENPRDGLVRLLKDRSIKVRKTELDKVLGTTKPDIIRNTEKHPDALDEYKEALAGHDAGPLTDDEFAEKIGVEVEEVRVLLAQMKAVAPGQAGANFYHRAVAALLSKLFGTSLGSAIIEKPIHDGMKKLDITYDNVAKHGFFHWVGLHHPASIIVVECKNYGKDAANPEFDQLAMRFSPSRGRVGILACRKFEDKQRALNRAKTIATDSNGYVLVLDDDDFTRLVDDFEDAGTDIRQRMAHPLLRDRFDDLIT